MLCSAGSGYSFTQTSSTSPSSTLSVNDTLVIGHEIGHNFGSPHTHCYTPAIDQCYNAEPGCYSGSKSCPTPTTMGGIPNVTGTLMSYCHLSGLPGCSSSLVFHPTSVTLLQPKIQSAVGTCVFPLAPPNTVFANGFESGGLVWSAHQP